MTLEFGFIRVIFMFNKFKGIRFSKSYKFFTPHINHLSIRLLSKWDMSPKSKEFFFVPSLRII